MIGLGDRQLRFQNVLLTNHLNRLKCWGHYFIIYSYLNSLPTTHVHARTYICFIRGFYSKLLKPCVGPSICCLMNTCIIPPMASSGVFLVHQMHSPFANGLIGALLRRRTCCLHSAPPKMASWDFTQSYLLIWSHTPLFCHIIKENTYIRFVYAVWWTVETPFTKIAGW